MSNSPLVRWFLARDAREQKVLIGGMVAAPLILLGSGVVAWHDYREALLERVQARTEDHQMLASLLPAMAGAPVQSGDAGTGDLPELLTRTASESGLAGALQRSQPVEDGAVRVEVKAARFSSVLVWLARLAERSGVAVISADIDAAGAGGLVDATLLLRRPGSP
ncbi:MAG: hypothetical protein RL026_2620 [Pseudomonadota bacterium]